MRNYRAARLMVGLLLLPLCGLSAQASDPGNAGAETPEMLGMERGLADPRQVRATIVRVAEWQLEHPASYEPQHWGMAPLYEGLIDAGLVTGDPRYLAAVLRAGLRAAFQPRGRLYSADALATAHAWLRIYLMDPSDPDVALFLPIKWRIDEILQNPVTEDLSLAEEPRTPGVSRSDRWTWADALYMAPPTIALLSQATGDDRYLAFIDRELRFTYDALFDPQENLFYRDERYIDDRTPGGEKVFWSRGNGWVFAGLAAVLTGLPADYPNRGFYLDIFRRMSEAVLETQQPDGLWYPSLKDPRHVPIGESSGSALFVFGLARGLSLGLLDNAACWPAVERGWRGLTTRIRPGGEVNYAQPIGAKPERFPPDTTRPYATGAVLSAGAEILRLLDAAVDVDPALLREQAEQLVDAAPDIARVRS